MYITGQVSGASNDLIDCSFYELAGARTLGLRPDTRRLTELDPHELAARTCVSVVSPGTELAAYRGDPPLRPSRVYPRLQGYCNVAEVQACGSAVRGVRPGDLVLTNQAHRRAFVCHERDVLAGIPENADRISAATTYLFHLAYSALLKGDFRPGCNVGVVGLGTLGMASVALASSFGGQVFAFTDRPASATTAREFGARSVLSKSLVDARGHIAELTGGTGLDLLIYTATSWSDWELALRSSRRDGAVCMLGFPGRGQPAPQTNPLASQHVYDYQLRLLACGMMPEADVPPHEIRYTLKRNCGFLLSWILAGKVSGRGLVGTVASWRDLAAVYDAIEARQVPLTAALDWRI